MTESVSFFWKYHALEKQASELPSAQERLNTAKGNYYLIHGDLRKAQKAVASNLENIVMQKVSIDRTSNHWLYSKTAFQPKLWMTGGVQGKIDRHQAKLSKAESEIPQLQVMVENLERQEKAAREELQKTQTMHDQIQESAREMSRMKEKVVMQHPSALLNRLVRQLWEMQNLLEKPKQEIDRLEECQSLLNHIKRCCDKVDSQTSWALNQSRRANQQANKEQISDTHKLWNLERVEWMRQEAEKALDDATQELQTGFSKFHKAQRFSNSGPSSFSGASSFSWQQPLIAVGGAMLHTVTSIQVRAEHLRLHSQKLRLAAGTEEHVLSEKQRAVNQELKSLQLTLSNVSSQIAAEKDDIFQKVRASTFADNLRSTSGGLPPPIKPDHGADSYTASSSSAGQAAHCISTK